jgi:hypothetical protein
MPLTNTFFSCRPDIPASRFRRIRSWTVRSRARAVLGPGAPSSRVVHDLAVRGAAALEQDREAAERAREFLLSVADGSSGLDLEGLRSVRDRAWR